MINTKITTGVFLALLGGLAALNLATPSRTFSENENRYLQKMPRFSAEALIDGKFTADFDRFVTDQFAFRDSWVGLKTLCELALQKHSSNGVYFAEDGYLIEMFDTVSREQYAKNLAATGGFSRRVTEGLGVDVHAMLAPTSSRALADKLPRNAPEVDQAALLVQAAEAVPGLVDVSAALEAHSDEYIYYRTDHHWTSLGAFYAYAEWRQQSGHTPPALADYDQETLTDAFYGTTYSKASLYTARPDTMTAFLPRSLGPIAVDYNNGETVTDTIYAREYLEVKDKYSTYLNANQPITCITTGNPNGERLLLIKDSFANTFVQMALADYTEIHVIDLRYFKLSVYDYIAENNITDVLLLYSVKNFSGDTNLYYLTT